MSSCTGPKNGPWRLANYTHVLKLNRRNKDFDEDDFDPWEEAKPKSYYTKHYGPHASGQDLIQKSARMEPQIVNWIETCNATALYEFMEEETGLHLTLRGRQSDTASTDQAVRDIWLRQVITKKAIDFVQWCRECPSTSDLAIHDHDKGMTPVGSLLDFALQYNQFRNDDIVQKVAIFLYLISRKFEVLRTFSTDQRRIIFRATFDWLIINMLAVTFSDIDTRTAEHVRSETYWVRFITILCGMSNVVIIKVHNHGLHPNLDSHRSLGRQGGSRVDV